MAKLRVVLKAGTQTSGNYSHAGRPGFVGGSKPTKVHPPEWYAYRARFNYSQRAYDKVWNAAIKAGKSKDEAKILATQARQMAYAEYDATHGGAVVTTPPPQVAPQKIYRDGKFANVATDQATLDKYDSNTLYDMSSPEVQALARQTGLLALDQQAFDYITKLNDNGNFAEGDDASLQNLRGQIRDWSDVSNWSSPAHQYGYGSPAMPDRANAADPNRVLMTVRYNMEDLSIFDPANKEQLMDKYAAEENAEDLDRWARNYGPIVAAQYQARGMRIPGWWPDKPTPRDWRTDDDFKRRMEDHLKVNQNDRSSTIAIFVGQLENNGKFDPTSKDPVVQSMTDIYQDMHGVDYNVRDLGYKGDLSWSDNKPFLGTEAKVVNNILGMYRTAAENGKWPVYGNYGDQVIRWQTMTKAQKQEVDTFLTNAPNMAPEDFWKVHSILSDERPFLKSNSNKKERFYPDGDYGSQGSEKQSSGYPNYTVTTVTTHQTNFDDSRSLMVDLARRGYGTIGEVQKAYNDISDEFMWAKPDGSMTYGTLAYINGTTASSRKNANVIADRMWKLDQVDNADNNYYSPVGRYNAYLRSAGSLGVLRIKYDDIDWAKADENTKDNNWMKQVVKIVQDKAGLGPTTGGKYSNFAALAYAPDKATEMQKLFDATWDPTGKHANGGTINAAFKVVPDKAVMDGYNDAVAKYGNEWRSKPSFHGTNYYAADRISSEGFKLDKRATGRLLGDGVYSTIQASKAGQYIKGGWGAHSGTTGPLLVLKIAAGKVFTFGKDTVGNIGLQGASSSYDYNKLPSYGYNTAYAREGVYLENYSSRLRYPESVSFDPKAIIPDYWLDITLK